MHKKDDTVVSIFRLNPLKDTYEGKIIGVERETVMVEYPGGAKQQINKSGLKSDGPDRWIHHADVSEMR